MATDDIPDHLPDSPQIEEAEFIFDGFETTEVSKIHDALLAISDKIREYGPDSFRYLILGNYDKRPKQRLRQAQELIEYFDNNGVTFLLSDLDVSEDSLDNFYIKYLYVLSAVDVAVLVAEDNDGGHELEVGEVQLSDLYVLKREYKSDSIDEDLEREKYDAMIAKLFEVMEQNGQLFGWSDYHGFARGVQQVVATRKNDSVAPSDRQIQESSSDRGEESVTIPNGWTVSHRETAVTLPDGTEHHVDDLAESIPDLSEYEPGTLVEWIDTERLGKHEEVSEKEIVEKLSPRNLIYEIADPPTKWVRYERLESDPSDVSVSIVWRLQSEDDKFRVEINWKKQGAVTASAPATAETLIESEYYADKFMSRFNQYLTTADDAIEAVESSIRDVEDIS